MSKKILIIDDEASIRQTLQGTLEDEGYEVTCKSSVLQGLEHLRKRTTDLVLMDIWMPEIDGLQGLQKFREENIEAQIVMMSGHGTIETAVKATKIGAFDFLEKPIELDRLLQVIRQGLQASEQLRENQKLRMDFQGKKQILGSSPAMKTIQDLVRKVAPTSGSVLITGENGTGKEIVAKSIHALSNRFKKPFIEVNCAAIPEELIESELFGHEKGAFTGAVSLKRGRFDLADGGTLFLDEIGDMSLKTQAKILRILQEQKFERVGGTETQTVDVRILAATNKDLKAEISKGSFREDLFFRLNVIRVQMPPLRDRLEDISTLFDFFMEEFSVLHQKNRRILSSEALGLLRQQPWPGNVRELRNLVERIVILQDSKDDPILESEIHSLLESDPTPGKEETTSKSATGKVRPLKDAKSTFERDFILNALKENLWNISKTAQALDIERSYLHRKMKAFGIDTPEE